MEKEGCSKECQGVLMSQVPPRDHGAHTMSPGSERMSHSNR